MPRPLWQLLIDFKQSQRERNITCDECFMILEFYADQLASGVDPQALKPEIKQHLAGCPDCRSKYIAWISRLEKNKPSSAEE